MFSQKQKSTFWNSLDWGTSYKNFAAFYTNFRGKIPENLEVFP
jgi:hypothetical protein